MGIPQKPNFSLMAQTSATVLVGERTMGSVMKPFSNLDGEGGEQRLRRRVEG
jgi:hypothetical protein